MILNNIKNNKDRGFTIVELLIVIVIIGILAAITIVSYTGITQRANTSSAQSNASSAIAKLEAYNADQSGYPATFSVLTGATSDKVYALSGLTLSATALAAQPTNPNVINYFKCVTGGVTSGVVIGYWNYSTGAINYALSGTTGTSTSTTIETVAPTVCTISAT